MAKRIDIPPMIEVDSCLRRDGDAVDPGNLRGAYYGNDLRAIMVWLHRRGVPFEVAGSPTRGARSIRTEDWEIFCPFRAWLTEPNHDDPESVYRLIREFHDTIPEQFRLTAARTFAKIVGRIPWIDQRIEGPAREAFTGGLQWSRPGVYLHTVTSDLREAYRWAMHDFPLPKKWSFIHRPPMMKLPPALSILKGTIRTNGRNVIPILPQSTGGMHCTTHGPGRTVSTGTWFGPDVIAASPFIEHMDIEWIAIAQPTFILNHRIKMEDYPRPLRKRLSLAGYGSHAQAAVSSSGIVAKEFYDACRHFGTYRVRATMHGEEDGLAVWWRTVPFARPYARMDWGGLVTARVRERMITEGVRLQKRGFQVARIYVDSITATCQASGYGNKAGEFKEEGVGPTIMGPPGVGIVSGKVKHAGMSEERAQRIIGTVRDGTYNDVYGETTWNGWTEDITSAGDEE